MSCSTLELEASVGMSTSSPTMHRIRCGGFNVGITCECVGMRSRTASGKPWMVKQPPSGMLTVESPTHMVLQGRALHL